MKNRLFSIICLMAILAMLAGALPVGAREMQMGGPVEVSLLAEIDTYTNVWAPDTGHDGSHNISVRRGGLMNGLVDFNLSAIPLYASVHKAQLKLYATTRSNTNSLELWVKPALGPWDGDVTFNTAPAVGDTGAMATVSSADAEVIIDVTALVQSAADDPAAFFGWQLEAPDTKSVQYAFLTSEFALDEQGPPYPRLEISYSPPPINRRPAHQRLPRQPGNRLQRSRWVRLHGHCDRWCEGRGGSGQRAPGRWR